MSRTSLRTTSSPRSRTRTGPGPGPKPKPELTSGGVGQVFLKVINHDHHSNFTLSVPLGYFHNPYFYEHMRLDVNINPIPIFVEPGGTSDWVDAGALLDTQVRPRPRSAPRPFRALAP